jgi:hypothetical protein
MAEPEFDGLDDRGLNRRALLAGGAALLAVSAAPLSAGLPDAPAACFLACRRYGSRYQAVILDARGHELAVRPLPDRGHSFAIDPVHQRAVVFGRQPGFFALAFGLDGTPLGELPLPEGRHFFGHGVFSADGTRLFATENDWDAGRGVLGVYDARPGSGWQRLGELDTGGIGPHEVVLLADDRTLCVANGGLLIHPDFGKEPLNLATMESSLTLVDARDGSLLEKHRLAPELFQLSIRHLAVDATGTVWFACQHQGPATEQPPLVGRFRRGQAPELLTAPPALLRELRNYIGSIAAGREVVATSSPVGGHVAFWHLADGHCLGLTPRPDGCGVAPLDDGRFLLTDGFGGLTAAAPAREGELLLAPSRELSWDNHLRRA